MVVKEANGTNVVGGVQCLNFLSYHPNSDCIELKKRGKKSKNEKLRFAKKFFLFLRVYELDIVLGVNTDRKNGMA